jgi:hypothetical protein
VIAADPVTVLAPIASKWVEPGGRVGTMSLVSTPETPPPIFGDPDGPHWSAFPPPGTDPNEEESADDLALGQTRVIRFRMPEQDVDWPLWDDGGLMPDEPDLLEQTLGLSTRLVAALADWGTRWNANGRDWTCTEAERDARRGQCATEAAPLVTELKNELGPNVRVVNALDA